MALSAKRIAKAKAWKLKNATRVLARKDRNVAKSSHGKFANVKALEAHRVSVSIIPEPKGKKNTEIPATS